MDVVYVIGRGSKHGDAELRWSLRSLERFGGNLGRVIVAGYPPDFLSDEVVKVSVPDSETPVFKHVNILNCILRLCEDGVVDGEFLYSSDDHFLVKDVDLDAYPYFVKSLKIRTADEYLASKSPFTRYRKSMAMTRDLLEVNGFGYVNWSCHANTHMHAHDAPVVKALSEWGYAHGLDLGFDPTCLFMNVRAARESIAGTSRPDCKIRTYGSKEDFDVRIGYRDTFSIADSVFDDPAFTEEMNARYPGKSRFES